MDKGSEFVADYMAYAKYASYIPEEERRETRMETKVRNKEMQQRKYPHLHNEIETLYREFIYTDKVLPSMRSMQFAGKSIEKKNIRMFNCAHAPVDHPKVFSEICYLLMCGTGVGYSVESKNVDQLPILGYPEWFAGYVVEDSIEGWANAFDQLINAYCYGHTNEDNDDYFSPVFDYSEISPKGTRLSSGSLAPGADKLEKSLEAVRLILRDVVRKGGKLTPLNVHDIICHIADAIVSGGIRRSACIAVFDWNDEEMLNCKVGDWWATNPQRGRSNNSVRLLKTLPEEELRKQYEFVVSKLKVSLGSGSGDPGIFFTTSENYGPNPCAEALLRYNLCNLVEINGALIQTQKDLDEASIAAASLATLQAGYTDFAYLRSIWQETTQKEALIGVGITSIVEGKTLELDMARSAELVKHTNAQVAELIGINKAYRTTVVKPSGSSTLYLGNRASGLHDAPSKTNYIRRIRVGKTEPVFGWLTMLMPTLVEDEAFDPDNTAVLSIPISVADPESYQWAETPIEFLDRVFDIYDRWIVPGHREGEDTNNPSNTCLVSPQDYDDVFEHLWENRDRYTGVSVLPKDDANYPQMPIEKCSQEVYNKLLTYLVPFDSKQIWEPEDTVDHGQEAACAGGQCALV